MGGSESMRSGQKTHVPPCSREEQKNYIGKIYPPGGIEIKKVRGVFLCFTWNKSCGYLSRGRGVKWAMLEHGEFFKVVYLTCKLVSIGGLTILFLILGGRGRLAKPNKS
jgi:hypothetical protein